MLGLSPPFLLAVALVVVGQVLLTQTVFGRHLSVANAETARLSGIAPNRLRFATLALSGLLAALAAAIDTSRFQTPTRTPGVGWSCRPSPPW